MRERHAHPKGPSFSSSLLDAMYRSIDESNGAHRRNTATKVEDDIESLRRAIIIEKWIENHSTPRHLPSNSASSTDSSVFSSSETESPKPKSRAHKIYGDFIKVKEPISPGAKISNFFNSIFSPRNFKSTTRQCVDHEWSSIRKSRSMKDVTTTCSTASSRSCLTKNASSRASKSKRSVRFCAVETACNHEFAKPPVGSQFIKKNIDSFRVLEGKNNVRKYELRDCYTYHSERDLDDMSCASSDLFELENIARLEEEEELPVYETTTIAEGRMLM